MAPALLLRAARMGCSEAAIARSRHAAAAALPAGHPGTDRSASGRTTSCRTTRRPPGGPSGSPSLVDHGRRVRHPGATTGGGRPPPAVRRVSPGPHRRTAGEPVPGWREARCCPAVAPDHNGSGVEEDRWLVRSRVAGSSSQRASVAALRGRPPLRLRVASIRMHPSHGAGRPISGLPSRSSPSPRHAPRPPDAFGDGSAIGGRRRRGPAV